MDLYDVFLAQLTDPFRIGMVIALMLTMLRTAAVTGKVVPLIAGVAFIAVLIPTTLQKGQGDLPAAIGVGLVSTSVLLAAAMVVRALVLRATGR